MPHFVYILRCSDDSYYVGVTTEIKKRVEQHNSGEGSKWTFLRRPVTLVYSERYEAESHALNRERQIKGWTKEKKKALIVGNRVLLKRLSRTRHRQ